MSLGHDRPPSPRTAVRIGAVVVCLAVVGGGAYALERGHGGQDPARSALDAFGVAWSAGHPETGGLADPAGVAKSYAAQVAGLHAGSPVVTPDRSRQGLIKAGKDRAHGRVHVAWTLAGGVPFAYDTAVDLARDDAGHWQVLWAPAVVHPAMMTGDRLLAVATPAPRAAIIGAQGQPLTAPRPVVEIGVEPARVKDLPALTARLAALLKVDGASLSARITAASPHAFVNVITLRRQDYDKVAAAVRPLPGTVFRSSQQTLAPTRQFARALLGTVGPVTAELLAKEPGKHAPGDSVGLSGLQRQYEARLAGTAGTQVKLISTDKQHDRTLLDLAARPGQPVTTTIDPAVQVAADAALAGQPKPSALVALRISTGEVLAVANGPDGGAYDLALQATVPPGSTFKVITTLALLEGGLDPQSPVLCAPTVVVNGRSFHNAEQESFGQVPFHTDFAKSCNTAFVSLAPRLGPDTLATTARTLGVGVTQPLGVAAFAGRVPVTTDPVERAASAFGQGQVLASPLSVALSTATVAGGELRPARLVTDPAPSTPSPSAPGAPLPAGPLQQLRGLMREVVTAGTGSAVAAVPGGAVAGKTGTAEHGSGPHPASHAWFTGWQGDIAFCVFVQDGEFGGQTAAPLAATFLTQLHLHPSASG